MFSALFNTFIYNPLYNALIVLLELFPVIDVGIAVILLTILVKLILFPLSRTAVRTQVALRALAPELERIKKKYKKDPQAQAAATMELYKTHGVNPFSGFFLILIQLPVIFGLYFIFLRGGLPEINTDILYSFVTPPVGIDMHFLGVLDITTRSVVVALFTGASQYVQIKLATPVNQPQNKKDGSLASSFASSMQFQMRYVMPVIVTVIAYTLPAMIGLYWTTSNLFMIGQELIVRRGVSKETDNKRRTTNEKSERSMTNNNKNRKKDDKSTQ